MTAVRETATFNNSERFAEGWYWALRSRSLRRGEVRHLELLGRSLAIYRGQDGQVRCVDAHCPHMGAHLAEGRVDGNSIRCFFHGWQFDDSGLCVDAPELETAPRACIQHWPTGEAYGMIWVWTGEEPRQPLPFVPELEGLEVDSMLGNRFEKACHPNVVMINAIDAHHFNTVHNLPVDLEFAVKKLNANALTFSNTTSVPPSNIMTRFIGRFYAGPLTYFMCYWYGSTGSVTVGPDFMHFHIMFALRALPGGKTEGQTILLTRRRQGPLAWLFNRVALFATRLVGDYFARGDTRIFQTIRFDFKTPTRADRSIIEFIRDLETQRARSWGDWALLDSVAAELPETGPNPEPSVSEPAQELSKSHLIAS